MQISKDSTHYRVYMWWYRHKYGRADNYLKASSNLCPYMRAVIFWAPIRFIFWPWVELFRIPLWDNDDMPIYLDMVTIPAILFALAKVFGYAAYNLKFVFFLFTISSVAISAVLALIVILTSYSGHRRRTSWSRPPRSTKETWLVRWVTKVDKGLDRITKWEFWKLLGVWLRSAHDNVCPPVQVVDENGQNLQEPAHHNTYGFYEID